MTEARDPRRELAEVEAALAEQEKLRGVLPDEQVEVLLRALGEKRTALVAQLHGSGAVAQGEGAVAAGAGGVAVRVDGDLKVGLPDETAATPEALRAAYLNRVIEETRQLSLSGVDPAVAGPDADTRLSLNAVYTALLTLSPREHDARRDPARLMAEREDRPLSALEQLNEHDRLVLLGDPGSGKSTFVNFVALSLAGEALDRPDVNLGHLTAPLPDDAGNDQEEGQPWDHGPLLPVRVVLRDFAARGLPSPGTRTTARHLWDFIAGELAAAGLADYAPQLRRELLEGGGMLLLDGLDEVPEAEKRRRQIKDAVEDFARSYGRCRVLLTSRTYAYQSQDWRLPDFAEAVLAPFSDGQIRRFVSRWYAHCAALGRLRPEAEAGRAELLKRAIFASDRLRFLARRPLLLTLMASLHAWRGGSLPERRERLYADTVELLLDSWERQRIMRGPDGEPVLIQPSLAEWLEVDREKVRQVLETLAFEAHAAQPELVGTADLPEGEVVARLMRLRDDPERNPTTLIDYLSQRAGLLEPRGVGVYTFPHRTFQEYLAACHLTGQGYPEEIAELARNDPQRWREVTFLAGAKAARGSASAVWQLVQALCFRDPDQAECEVTDEWGAHLAAQALLESADLSQVSNHNRAHVERLRRWLVRLLASDHLPAGERAQAGITLARLGDPRFDPDAFYLPRTPTLGFVQVPGGTFLMGSDRKRDEYARVNESPQHRLELPAFYVAQYPVTVQQFAAFVADSSYQDHDPDSLKGESNHPVVVVSWYDALTYCRWLGGKLRVLAQEYLRHRSDDSGEAPAWAQDFWRKVAVGQLRVTLPSEAEWEKAARGTDGRIFPWCDQPDPERANYHDTGIVSPTAAGCFPGGGSRYGCEEMSGNVWEWTRSLWGKKWGSPDYGYPYDRSGDQENQEAPSGVLRVLRGGSFVNNPDLARCAYRHRYFPHNRNVNVGFRVVLSPSALDSEPSGL